MKKDPKLGKHSHNNRESKEGTLLRLIREYQKLSLGDVALKVSLKVAEIDHFENGRKFYKEEDIQMFLDCYKISKEEFSSLLSIKVLNKVLVNHFLMQKK